MIAPTKTSQPWKTMSDEELLDYTKNIAASGCQSSEWEGIPLNQDRLHKQLFQNYKNLRDGE